MKSISRLTTSSTVRIVWMLTAAIFFGAGVGMVWWPSSQAIGAIQSQAKALYDEANENEVEIRHAAELHALARRVTDDVRALSGRGSESAAMAAILALLSREARAFKIDVRSIVPATTAIPVASTPLAGVPIEVDARGHFRELLAFVSDVPRHDVLIDMSDISLDGEGNHTPSPVLSAKIHATLFRYRGTAREEMEYASGSL
jgi:Tfp pilus assembly protein PilO